MRVALWNASGLDNLGDRLLDHINRRELGRRLPTAEFHTFSPFPSTSMEVAAIGKDGDWEHEGQFDAIVIGGGALLIGPPFIHPSLQTCYLGPYPERFRDRCPVAWNAVCCDAQYVCLLTEPWRGYVRAAASRLTYRSVRNQRTSELLKDCGVLEPIHVVPDPVCLLTTSQTRRVARQRLRVGLALGLSENSLDFLRQLQNRNGQEWNTVVRAHLDEAFSRSYQDSIPLRTRDLIHSVSAQTRDLRRHVDFEVCAFGAVYGDRDTAGALSTALGYPMAAFSDRLGSDVLDWIRSLDCLVGSRLHACVMALAAGTPFVGLDPYFNPVVETSKLREFMDGCGLISSYAPLSAFLEGQCSLDTLVSQALKNRRRLPEIHRLLVNDATSHFDRLADAIRQGRPPGRIRSRDTKEEASKPAWRAIKLTQAKLRTVTVNVNNRCPLRCRHCSVGFSAHYHGDPERMTREGITQTVAAIDPLVYDMVLLAGGEPSLDPEVLRAAIQRCRESHLLSAVVTAPIWASTRAKASRFLNQVRGLDMLLLSYDRYHLEFLALSHYEMATRLAQEYGVKVVCHLTYATEREKQELVDSLGSLRNLVQISTHRAVPVGNAAEPSNVPMEQITVRRVDDLAAIPRNCVLGNAHIDRNGAVHGCCWSRLAEKSPFTIANNGTSLTNRLSALENDHRFTIMRTRGFLDSLSARGTAALARMAEGRSFANECHLCLAAMREAGPEVWNECTVKNPEPGECEKSGKQGN